MRKQIDGSTKYETVRQIEAGKISIRHAAEQLGVHPSSVQAWVRLYETEGISGFAKQKNQVYSEALKVKAVEDYLSGKGSLAAICKKYKIRARIQLQDWIKVYNAHGDFNSRKNSGGGSYMKQGRDTTQEERIQIVKDCLASGKDYGEMALKLQGKLPAGTHMDAAVRGDGRGRSGGPARKAEEGPSTQNRAGESTDRDRTAQA